MEKYYIYLIINKELYLNNDISEEMYNKVNNKINELLRNT